jgi:hypothetical protein
VHQGGQVGHARGGNPLVRLFSFFFFSSQPKIRSKFLLVSFHSILAKIFGAWMPNSGSVGHVDQRIQVHIAQ